MSSPLAKTSESRDIHFCLISCRYQTSPPSGIFSFPTQVYIRIRFRVGLYILRAELVIGCVSPHPYHIVPLGLGLSTVPINYTSFRPRANGDQECFPSLPNRGKRHGEGK